MRLVVTESAAKKRLDVFLTESIEGVSRSFIEKLCEQGKVSVNDQPSPGRYKVKSGDEIIVEYDFDQAKLIPKIDLPIIYEDDDCVVINKPAGILTHSKGAFNPEATVATFIAAKLHGFTSDERAGIVHRLDRATSGVIICAKNPEALSFLQKQFSQRKVKKVYHAVIPGTLDPPEALIDIPIGRNPRNPKMFYATVHGKTARTKYKIIKTNNNHSMVELQPETGRTHQLRVHMAYLKHPIVGDDFYGGEPADRLLLHASSLEITLPNRQREVFSAALPKEFKANVSS